MTERHCGNCEHEGLGRYICEECDDDCSEWSPLTTDADSWKATARRMAAEAREWRREAELPLYLSTASGDPLAWDLHLAPTSPLVNAGALTDPELHRVIDNLRKGDELRGRLKAREMARDARSWRGQAETDAETIEEFAAEIAELEHVLDTYTDQRVCPACSSRRNIAGAYHGRRYCEACQHEWDVTP